MKNVKQKLVTTSAVLGWLYAAGAAAQVPAMGEPAVAPTVAEPRAATATPAPGGDDIVVTARRENETLQNVPATVSVLTAKTIQQTGAKIATDFINLSAGVSIATGATEPGDTSINIRGLNGARDAENNVALVVDGVLKTNSSALNQMQGALQQVEILKGPQGAIYGRNASAGAIVITTRKPTDHFTAEVKGSAATDNSYSGSVLLSGPITDQIGFVLAADYDRSDGYFRNSFLGTALAKQVYPDYPEAEDSKSIDYYRKGNLFGRLLIAPSDETEIDIKAHGGFNHSGAISYNAIFQIPTLAASFNDSVFNIQSSDHKFVFTNNTVPHSYQQTYDASLRLTQKLDFASLIASVAYSNIRDDYYAGGTSGAFGFFDNEPTCQRTRAETTGVINQEPFTTYQSAFGFAQPYAPSTCDGIQYQKRKQSDVVSEIRLVSNPGGALSWQLGGSYIFIDRRTCISLQLDTGIGGERKCYATDAAHHTEELQDDNYRSNIYSAFASTDYALTSQLKIGAALRYDIEARGTSNNVPVDGRTWWVGNPLTGHPDGTVGNPANYYLNAGLDPAYNPSGILAPRNKTFKQAEPKLTMTYRPTANTTLFADWGIGFKAGGFNSGGSKAIVDGFFNAPVSAGGVDAGVKIDDDYKKETTSAFEAGVKGKALGFIHYELVGYYTQVRNMQFFEFFVGDFGQLRVISNIDRVRIWGLEATLNANITRTWSVFAAGNYTNSRIQKNSSRPYTVGNKSPATPDFTLNFGTQLTEPLTDSLNAMIRTDLRVVGPTPFHTVQDNTVPTIFSLDANFANTTRKTFTTVNVRAGVQSDRWSITAFATNLFNTQHLEEAVEAPEFGGDFVSPGNLRRYGIELGYKF